MERQEPSYIPPQRQPRLKHAEVWSPDGEEGSTSPIDGGASVAIKYFI